MTEPSGVQQPTSGHALPPVTVVIPTYQEAAAIEDCLASIEAQTYPRVVEILVVDGGSTDGTRQRASRHPGVTVLHNPRRTQAAALNLAIADASGEIIVRVDGHCRLAADYVERCVAALEETGAAMVGGGMHPVADGPVHGAIAAAMRSRFGAGPARFHVGGPAGWVDTVYLGAYRTSTARALGGYAEAHTPNEDAELAHRMRQVGGVWYDPMIQSTYSPRASLRALGRQFFFYGQGRSRTARQHPRSVKPRQLSPPLLLLALLLPGRRRVASAYLLGVAVAAAVDGGSSVRQKACFAMALPTMHLSWGVGFLLGLAGVNFHRRGHPPVGVRSTCPRP